MPIEMSKTPHVVLSDAELGRMISQIRVHNAGGVAPAYYNITLKRLDAATDEFYVTKVTELGGPTEDKLEVPMRVNLDELSRRISEERRAKAEADAKAEAEANKSRNFSETGTAPILGIAAGIALLAAGVAYVGFKKYLGRK